MPTRMLREGILSSERVDKLSPAAEVFYRRLMSVVDDFGRFSAHPKLLRTSCYPLRLDTVSDADITQWLQECIEVALIISYTVDGKPYLEFVNFKQRTRAKSGKCPPPPALDGKRRTHDGHMPDTCLTHDGHMPDTCLTHDRQARRNARLDGEGGRSQTCRYHIQHLETCPESETVTKTVRGTESVTVTDSVRGTEAKTLTDSAQNPYRFGTKTLTVLVRGKEQTIEHTNNKPINMSGKPDNADTKKPAYTQKTETETIKLESSETESDAEMEDGVGQIPVYAGKKAGESKAELHARAGKKAALSAAAHELIHYLNAKTGRDYRLVASNVRLVQARLREGATVEQVKAVIDAKVRQWGPDPTMAEYLRPATLFGAMKFEQYLGQLNGRGPAASRLVHDARCVN